MVPVLSSIEYHPEVRQEQEIKKRVAENLHKIILSAHQGGEVRPGGADDDDDAVHGDHEEERKRRKKKHRKQEEEAEEEKEEGRKHRKKRA
jgi:hypothetical protein